MADTPTLLDWTGKPIKSRGLYPLPLTHPQDSRPRPIVRAKIYENQSARERWEQVNYSMVIASRVPAIKTALKQQANWAVGDAWHVSYNGVNEGWGEVMEQFINEVYYRDCNVLGKIHDFHSTLKQLCHTIAKQADYGAVFDEKSGKAQFMDYSRFGAGFGYGVAVGKGLENCNELGVGPSWSSPIQWGYGYASGWGSFIPYYVINDPASLFNGQRMVDGRIVDANLRPLGMRVLGYDNAGKPTFVDMPESLIHFNFEADEWLNQLRGIPSLATLLDDCNAVEDAKYYWEQAVLNSASRAVTRTSKDGRPPVGGVDETEVEVPQADGTTKKFTVRVERNQAGVYELSSDNGEELKTLDFNRPAPGERELIKQLETAYLHEHWPRGLIYTDDIDRAAGRAITQQVRQIIWSKQRTLERTARWWIDRAINWAMRTGKIPMNNLGADPYDYEFSLPGEFTIDESYDGKLQMTLLGRCCITRGIITAKNGLQEKKVRKANVASVRALATEAEAIAKDFEWLSPMEALNRLDNNGNVNQPPQPSEASGTPANDKETKTPKTTKAK